MRKRESNHFYSTKGRKIISGIFAAVESDNVNFKELSPYRQETDKKGKGKHWEEDMEEVNEARKVVKRAKGPVDKEVTVFRSKLVLFVIWSAPRSWRKMDFKISLKYDDAPLILCGIRNIWLASALQTLVVCLGMMDKLNASSCSWSLWVLYEAS